MSKLLQGENSYCISCHEKISKNAIKCFRCNSYQKTWLNWVEYGSRNTALVTLIATAIFWITLQLPNTTEKINLVRFFPFGPVVISNDGNIEVFISDIFIQPTGIKMWKAVNPQFNAIIKPNEKLIQDVKTFTSLNAVDVKWLTNSRINDDNWNDLVKKFMVNDKDECHEIAFFLADDPYFVSLQELTGKKLRTFPAMGYIQYYSSIQEKFIKKPIVAVGTIVGLEKPQCK